MYLSIHWFYSNLRDSDTFANTIEKTEVSRPWCKRLKDWSLDERKGVFDFSRELYD